MRKSKVKQLRKKWLELKQNPQYNIKGKIVEGQTFRQFKKKAI
jgi:hypothetical protein